MSTTGARSGGVDLLAQTTLVVDRDATQNAVGNLIAALQRVPGVLFARQNGAESQVVVSHDAGVSRSAFFAAAGRVAVRVRIPRSFSGAAPVSESVPPAAQTWLRGLRVGSMLVVGVLAIVSIGLPSAKAWAMPAYGVAIGVYLFLQVLSVRRPS